MRRLYARWNSWSYDHGYLLGYKLGYRLGAWLSRRFAP
jgi:hypothetical protein